jgi:hypothetical protein
MRRAKHAEREKHRVARKKKTGLKVDSDAPQRGFHFSTPELARVVKSFTLKWSVGQQIKCTWFCDAMQAWVFINK